MPDNQTNTAEDFAERFNALQDEALEYGIISVVALYVDDPLAKTESMKIGYKGCGPTLLSGIATSIMRVSDHAAETRRL